MRTRNRSKSHRVSCLPAVLGPLALLAVYYFVQAALRTPPLGDVQVIAHRGASHAAPENTLAAFHLAVEQGSDWLEFDVWKSRDGALVVIHDETVDRTTNGTGAVRDLTLEQLRALDAGQGQKIPTAGEVIALAKSAGVLVLPEAKGSARDAGIEQALLEQLAAADYLERAVIQSFDAASLLRFRQLDPNASLCSLTGLWRLDLGSPPADAAFVCPMAEMVVLNPFMVVQAHRAGRQVFVYFGILEGEPLIRVMRFFGVDGMIVDDPEQLVRVLSSP